MAHKTSDTRYKQKNTSISVLDNQTVSKTVGNAKDFFSYTQEQIDQIEKAIESSEKSEALELVRKLKAQINILENRLSYLPNNFNLFSNLDDISLGSRLIFQPELRAKIQRLRKELEDLKKKSFKRKQRTYPGNKALINNFSNTPPLNDLFMNETLTIEGLENQNDLNPTENILTNEQVKLEGILNLLDEICTTFDEIGKALGIDDNQIKKVSTIESENSVREIIPIKRISREEPSGISLK